MISRTSWTTFEMKTFGPDCGAAKNFLQNKIERFKIVYLGIFKISEHSCIKPWEFWSFELFSSSGSKYCLKASFLTDLQRFPMTSEKIKAAALFM